MSDAVLLVDDEAGVLKALQRVLTMEGYVVHLAGSGEEALEILQTRKFKVIISDERMPGMAGSEFLGLASLRHPETVRIMLTGHSSIEGAMRAVNEGQIYRFLLKPWNDAELRLAVRSAVDFFDLQRKNRQLLTLVRSQALRLRHAERRQPGITLPERQEDGSFLIEEPSEEEIADLLGQCRDGIC